MASLRIRTPPEVPFRIAFVVKMETPPGVIRPINSQLLNLDSRWQNAADDPGDDYLVLDRVIVSFTGLPTNQVVFQPPSRPSIAQPNEPPHHAGQARRLCYMGRVVFVKPFRSA
jgi:hypothetical protein